MCMYRWTSFCNFWLNLYLLFSNSSPKINLEELDSFQSLQEILLKIKERALNAVTSSSKEAKTTEVQHEDTPGLNTGK